ncbi:hypothetical protein CBR_g50566 [Chara braunii]|uniref:Reverse transcriptase domain-containing protein n=1 Tax=Chara braunii TaxID=69332 RepID=A0A388M6U2_CHABU|nr:hypothetical protein CBR_g50566 [Chara braunii]|eukprot:GBG90317.1 hypothetical protein CBR_g50566 [Chara braunii]
MDDYPMYGLLVGFSLRGTLWRFIFPLGFWNTFMYRVDTRTGTSTSPYTTEPEAKAAAILKERREKKEAKKKALMEEQAAKMKKIEEEMAREKERLKREEEAKLKAVEEEEEEEEQPLERQRVGGRGEPSGTKEDQMEKKITEWVVGLSLGKDEEALMYVPREEQEAAIKEWDAEEDPLKRQVLEDEKRMEWKFRLTRERKRRMEAASQAGKELEEIKKQRDQMATKVDLLGKVEIMARNTERLARVPEEQFLVGRSQDIAMRSIRLGLRDFVRELATQVGSEVEARLDSTERYCTGAIEGAKLAAPKEEEVRPRREPIKVKFPDSSSGKKEENFDNWEANIKTYVHLQKEKLEEQVFVVYVGPVTEPKEEKPIDPAIAKLLEEFKDLAELPTGVVPRPIQHRIEIEHGSRTPKGAVYKISPQELEELRKQLDELLEKSWIGLSSSPFGAPMVFVPKKEGELRMCIDYRGLNAITVKNVEPLPRIDDLLDRVQGCKYFSKIDLKSGYHQIEVHPDDQYKTAFRTRYGHYEFIVMPFGLTNAPATFQRCMNDLFRLSLDKFVVVYLDDILVFSKTLQEHQGHLRQVLEKLREANFKINPKKCEWAKTQVLYLGHVLDGDGIKPEDSKIAAIKDWPTPRTLTELRSFSGLANYYRKFVRNFSTIAAPLRRLLKKETIWKWDKDCTSAMKKLKQALIEYPVFKVADPSLSFVVTIHASQYGIGAVLQQDDGSGYRPVEFMSARMSSEKVATSTYERELYDLRQALEHWKHYLLGRHFKVYLDHETLRWLKTQAKMTPKLTRWAEEINQYDFELKPIKGKYNVLADALSRRSYYFGAIVHYLDIGKDLQQKVREAYA